MSTPSVNLPIDMSAIDAQWILQCLGEKADRMRSRMAILDPDDDNEWGELANDLGVLEIVIERMRTWMPAAFGPHVLCASNAPINPDSGKSPT